MPEPSADQPDLPPEAFQSMPDQDSPRARKIATAKSLLTGRNAFQRYAASRGEVDPELWHHHRASLASINRHLAELPERDQELVEALFPLDGSEQPDLADERLRTEIAEQFGFRPGDFDREVDLAVERYADRQYAGVY